MHSVGYVVLFRLGPDQQTQAAFHTMALHVHGFEMRQRLYAGGPLVNPDSAVTTSEEPRRLPAFGAPRVPQTAASTSRPFGSPFPHAPFGSPLSDQPEGSVMGSAVGSAPRHAPFGSPLQAPAFGSGSISPSSSFANEAFFTPAATANPRGQHAAPDSTAAAGNAAFGTPGTVYGTPGSAPGTPLSGFGSPAYHTPAARAGDHTPGMFGSGVHGTPASVSQYGTPAAGITTPGLALRGPKLTDAHADTPGVGAVGDGAASGPFGAPAFGSKPLLTDSEIVLTQHADFVFGTRAIAFMTATGIVQTQQALSVETRVLAYFGEWVIRCMLQANCPGGRCYAEICRQHWSQDLRMKASFSSL